MRPSGFRPARRAACIAAGAAIAILFAACAAKPVRKFVAQPSAPPPWRLAILPAQPTSGEPGKDGKVKRVHVSARTLEEIRVCLTMAMPGEPFEVIPIPYVDGKIAGMDLNAETGSIQEVARGLQADLVLLPGTYSWNRKYYLLHGVARVGIEARVYDGATGELVFMSMREQVKNQGIFKIPAGYLAVVAGPILGLQHTHMSDMCHKVSEKIAADLLQMYQAARSPEAGPSAAPDGDGAPAERPPGNEEKDR